MNTSYLKTYIEVINTGNISKAAEKLFITQPAVSKQLQILEKDFGTVLFKKNGRELVPTEDGQIFYKYAIKILNEENKMYSMLCDDKNGLSGNIIVYTSYLPANYYIHDLIMGFYKNYPEVSYEIKKMDSKLVLSSIEEGLTSFGFTGTRSKNKKIKNICIAEDEIILAASKEFYDKNIVKQNISFDLLYNFNFIIREKGSATLQIFEDYIINNNIKLVDLKIKVVAEDNELLKTFALNNLGIAVVSRKAVEDELYSRQLIQINVNNMKLKRKLYYVYHKDRYFSKIEEKFKEYIISKFNI